jgi:hypothetical protein
LASSPTARTWLLPARTATTDGSRRTIPWSLTYTSVLAVPRSIPISFENNPKTPLNIKSRPSILALRLHQRSNRLSTPLWLGPVFTSVGEPQCLIKSRTNFMMTCLYLGRAEQIVKETI